ncbi:MAG TPA: carbonic anhydrase [Solirubrobacteraceae bacterium]
MNPTTELLARNERFVQEGHSELSFLPRLRTCIVTCPDPRVDPAQVLGIELGDAAVVRAAGGRVSPIVLQQLLFLQLAGAAAGQSDVGLELVLMQHTDCGITHLQGPEHREALAAFLGVAAEELDQKAVADPHAGIRVDIDALAANPFIPGSLSVSGLVYDVASGRAELVERRSPLREERTESAPIGSATT